jgi:hypothetical protein
MKYALGEDHEMVADQFFDMVKVRATEPEQDRLGGGAEIVTKDRQGCLTGRAQDDLPACPSPVEEHAAPFTARGTEVVRTEGVRPETGSVGIFEETDLAPEFLRLLLGRQDVVRPVSIQIHSVTRFESR